MNTDNLILRIDPERLAYVFAELHDSGYAEPEFAGQYIHACAQEFRRSGNGEFLSRARVVVEGMLKGQRMDGYLGTYVPGKEFDESFSVWNQQFAIKGLLSYHEITGETAALNAAIRCANFIVHHYLADDAPEILRSGNQCVQHTCILEQMVRLFTITGTGRYLDFAEFVVQRWEAGTIQFISGPLERDNPLYAMGVLKAAECLICYSGIIELARVTDNARYREAAKRYWELIDVQQINVIGCGSLTELWAYQGNKPSNTPIDVQPNETCVAYLWMRVSAQLFELTGESRYMDAFEKTLLNHIIGAQARDGSDFSYYQGLVGRKVHVKEPSQYSCCRYRGMLALSTVSNYLVTAGDDVVRVNLFATNTSTFPVDGLSVTITQETDFPRSGTVRLIVQTDGALKRALKVRFPAWSGDMKVAGAPVAPGPDGYVLLADSLSPGTQIFELVMEMTVRVQTATVDHVPSACVAYGPLMLAIDSRYGTPIHSTAVDLESIELARQPEDDLAPLVRFTCPGTVLNSPAEVTLVDYASAGSIDNENDWFKVWIPVVGGA